MANIARIHRRGISQGAYYKPATFYGDPKEAEYVGHAKHGCNACRWPGGQFVDTGTGEALGFGPETPGARQLLVDTFVRYQRDRKDFTKVELVGYGDCTELVTTPIQTVEFALSDGRAGTVDLRPGAADADALAEIQKWTKRQDPLVGSAL